MPTWFQFSWVYTGNIILGHLVSVCLTFWGIAKLFFKHAAASFCTLCISTCGFYASSVSSTLALLCVVIRGSLVPMEWYLCVVLIDISLMTNGTEHLFLAFAGLSFQLHRNQLKHSTTMNTIDVSLFLAIPPSLGSWKLSSLGLYTYCVRRLSPTSLP